MTKTLFIKIFAVAVLILLTFSGCREKEPEKVPVMAGINAEQNSYVVRNSDIEAMFVITTSEPVSEDMVFAVTATATSDGMYVLNDKNVNVMQGERSAAGSVIFVASKFTVTDPSLDLRISAQSAQAQMYDNASSVNYKVTFEPIIADISASVSSVTVEDRDVTVNFTVKLSRNVAEDTSFIIDPFGAPAEAYNLTDGGVVNVKNGTDEVAGSVVFLSSWFESHPGEEVNLSLELITESAKVVIPANPDNPEENISVVITASSPPSPAV